MAASFPIDWVKEVSGFSDSLPSFINTELQRSKPGGLLQSHTFTLLHHIYFFFFSHSHKELRDLYTFQQPHTSKGVKSPAAMGSTVSWKTFLTSFHYMSNLFSRLYTWPGNEDGSPCDAEAADDFGFSDSAGSSHRHQTLPVCEPRAMGQFGSGTGAAQIQLHPWLKQTSTLRPCLSAC